MTLGKWWGSRDKHPVLCLHGWQDNANSFDTLLPLLSSNFSYLAVDFPGHGYSSHFPQGISYKTYESTVTIRRVQQYFNWKKFSFLSHSLGAIWSFLFCSVFPNDIHFYIAIDAIKPLSENIDMEIKKMSGKMERILTYDSYTGTANPSYTREDLIKRWLEATRNSLTEQSCQILFERGTQEFQGLYRLTRDVRVRESVSSRYSDSEILEMAKSINCNVLYVQAQHGYRFKDENKITETTNIIKQNAKRYEHHLLPGTHHIHLNTPEIVAPVINTFMESTIDN